MWPTPWILTAVGAASALVVYWYQGLVYRRLRQFAHLPQIKPSLIFGHLAIIADYIKAQGTAPGMAGNSDEVFSAMMRDIGNPEIMVVDLRPITNPILFVRTHAVAEQVTKQSKNLPYSCPKAPGLEFMDPLIGTKSIISAQGHKWRELRKRYNPGFAPQHLISLLPLISSKTLPFLAKLDHLVETGENFALEPLLTSLTFDIIGSVTMGVDFKAQLPVGEQSEIVQLYRDLLVLYYNDEGGSPWWTQPITRLKRRLAARRVDARMKIQVRQKFDEMKAQRGERGGDSGSKNRSVLGLSLQDEDQVTDDLVDETVDQLKSFMFAGHDTTSILLQWAIYEVYRQPRVLRAFRAELDELFGNGDDDNADPTVVHKAFADRGDELMAKMPYTSAVIKETLRLHPPAATSRYMPPGSNFHVKLSDGSSVCVDGTFLFLCHPKIQVDEAVYGPTASEFLPERWLGNTNTRADPADDEKEDKNGGRGAIGNGTGPWSDGAIPASAWRPFERGPRSCIGQELANIEARLILACAVRKYDFEKVGTGAARLDDKGEPVVDEKGRHVSDSKLHIVRQVTARPSDGIEVRVKLRRKMRS